jgi:hypothetical protein
VAEDSGEGFAPSHFDSEIVALGQPGDAITAGQFTGEEAPPTSYFEGLVAALGAGKYAVPFCALLLRAISLLLVIRPPRFEFSGGLPPDKFEFI